MRKLTRTALVVIAAVLALTACEDSVSERDRETQETSFGRAQQLYPVPEYEDFPAREAITRHMNRWQNPNVISYVTLWLEGVGPVGYYEAQGQIVSTCQSISAPDWRDSGSNGAIVRQAPSPDGTYYANSECGWYFETADTNTYVEWHGRIQITDHPLPLDIPNLEDS